MLARRRLAVNARGLELSSLGDPLVLRRKESDQQAESWG